MSAAHLLRSTLDVCRRVAAVTAAMAVPALASASTVSLLNNGGFETPFSVGLDLSISPSDYGRWAVGDAAATTAGVNGINPFAGSLMMDFVSGGSSSDVYQIVDLRAYAAQIDAGLVRVDTQAYFNAVARASVGMALLRWTGTPTTLSGGFTFLHSGVFPIATDADLSTWQPFGYTGTVLAAGTRFLGFGVNSPTTAAQTYVDNASLILHINDGLDNSVPEPGTISLVVAAAMSMLLARRVGSSPARAGNGRRLLAQRRRNVARP